MKRSVFAAVLDSNRGIVSLTVLGVNEGGGEWRKKTLVAEQVEP
jgi:hypothetical protein